MGSDIGLMRGLICARGWLVACVIDTLERAMSSDLIQKIRVLGCQLDI